jgi:hypothetical protein
MTNTTMNPTERDTRVAILTSFLTTPHGRLAELAPLHADAQARDPMFYGPLAVMLVRGGGGLPASSVRDHKVLAVAHLFVSEFPEYREAAFALLQDFPPFMVEQVLTHLQKVIGKVPRVFKSAVAHYLRALEANAGRFGAAAVRSREPLTRLYASMHIKPGATAQAILFDNVRPAGSRQAALKALAASTEPAEQARIIVENRIPYTSAVGAVRQITPEIVVAFVETMSAAELQNHLKSLQRRGAFDNAEIKAMIEQKIADGVADGKVATFKADTALANVDLDESTRAALVAATDARVDAMAKITRPTALDLDISGSMEPAIALARDDLAPAISAIMAPDVPFFVYAQSTEAVRITSQGTTRSAWQQAFRMVRSNGWTSLGAATAQRTRQRVYVEQIIHVTDLGENRAPYFAAAYEEYAQAMAVRPDVIVVGVAGGQGIREALVEEWQRRGIPATYWKFGGDRFSLPNLLAALTMPSKAELVEAIMATTLPARPVPLAAA